MSTNGDAAWACMVQRAGTGLPNDSACIVKDMTARQVSGIYHDPPIWVGARIIDFASDDRQSLRRLREEIFREQIADSIELMVTREGLFAFDFEKWAPGHMPADGKDGTPVPFEKTAETHLNRTLVINSFLALLYTWCSVEQHHLVDRMVATPELLISMDTLSADSDMGFGNQRVSHLALSGFESTYVPGGPVSFDDRLSFRHFELSPEGISHVVANLSQLLDRRGLAGLLLVDLFLRASKSFQEHNYAAALINYWAVSERLIQEMWAKFQADQQIVDKKRLDRLNDSRTFTAAVTTEVLALGGSIAVGLYDQISNVRKARNDWIHGLKSPISASDAIEAAGVCRDLMQRVLEIQVVGDAGLRLHG